MLSRMQMKLLVLMSVTKLLVSIRELSVLSYYALTVRHFDVPWDRVGYYQGIGFACSLASMCVSGCWYGWALHRCDKKNVFVFSGVAYGVATLAFGCSTNVTMLIVTQLLSGLASGTTIAIRVIVHEVYTDRSIQSYIMTYALAAPYTAAIVVGPALGGALALPVQQYGGIFRPGSLFDLMPVLLPNLVIAFALLLVSLISFLLLPARLAASGESLPLKSSEPLPKTAYGRENSSTSLSDDSQFVLIRVPDVKLSEDIPGHCHSLSVTRGRFVPSRVTWWEPVLVRFPLLRNSDFLLTCLLNMCFQASLETFYIAFSLWIVSPDVFGGLNYSPLRSGNVYLLPGILAIVFDYLVLGKVNKLLMPRRGYVFWTLVNALFIGTMACFGAIQNWTATFFLCSLALGISRIATSGCKVSLYIFCNNSVGKDHIAMASSLYQLSGYGSSAVASLIGGRLYSWSLSNEVSSGGVGFPVNHYFTFYVASFIALLGGCIAPHFSDSLDGTS